jgi:hypothetical protein
LLQILQFATWVIHFVWLSWYFKMHVADMHGCWERSRAAKARPVWASDGDLHLSIMHLYNAAHLACWYPYPLGCQLASWEAARCPTTLVAGATFACLATKVLLLVWSTSDGSYLPCHHSRPS